MPKQTHKPFPLLSIAILAAIPLTSVPLGASLSAKHKAAEELDAVMDKAEHVYSSGRGLFSVQAQREQKMEEARAVLDVVERKKAIARRRFVLAMRESERIEEEYGFDMTSSGTLIAAIEKEEQRYVDFLQYLRNKTFFVAATGPDLGITLVRNLLTTSLGEVTDMSMRTHAIARARERVLRITMEAKDVINAIALHEGEYQLQSQKYEQAWKVYMEAKGAYDSASNRIAEVQRITNEVQSSVTKLQRELARIDAQLVSKLERELIEKGLMDAQPGERSDGRIRSNQPFRWPVVGRISAGFHNASYKQFFGVAHKGIDIVVGQGTPVSASADGVVYLARDGGKYGYSYVLVGHRNGVATLYGHLSQINVSSGQEIAAGQIVGLSGGTPGTYGAGPMTTGAHLHFEVIKNGVHLDPHTILP